MSEQPVVNHVDDRLSPSSPPELNPDDPIGGQNQQGEALDVDSRFEEILDSRDPLSDPSPAGIESISSQMPAESISQSIQMSEGAVQTIIGTPDFHSSEMNVAELLFRDLAERCGQSLSSMLHANLVFQLSEIRATAIADLQQDTHSSSIVFRVESSCQPSTGFLTIDAGFAAVIVDRMLGGDCETAVLGDRELTAMESRLLLRFVTEVGAEIQKSLDPDLVGVPSLRKSEGFEAIQAEMQDTPSLLVVSFLLGIANHRGVLRLVVPCETIRELPLSRAHLSTDVDQEISRVSTQSKAEIGQTKLEVAVTVATSKVRTSDLLDLNIGDIITTEKLASETLELLVQGVPKFKVQAGAYQGKKAVQILEVIERSKD